MYVSIHAWAYVANKVYPFSISKLIHIYIYNSLFSNSLSRRKKDSHSRCGLSFQKPIHPIADCSFGLLSLFSAIQVTGLQKHKNLLMQGPQNFLVAVLNIILPYYIYLCVCVCRRSIQLLLTGSYFCELDLQFCVQ